MAVSDCLFSVAQSSRVPNNIRAIRRRKGLSLEAVAERMGTSAQQLSRLERGQRPLTEEWARKAAKAMEADFFEVFGNAGDTRKTVPVVGYVADGAVVREFDRVGELDRVPAPPDADEPVAVVVVGNAMWPAFVDGDLLFYEPEKVPPPSLLIGRECVVQTADGRRMVRRLFRSPEPNRFRLASYNAPDEDGVVVEWASPVEWIKRR